MYCVDTNKLPAVLVNQMEHVPDMAVDEAKDIGKAVRAIRDLSSGNGELCIPLIGGFLDKIRMTLTIHRGKRKLSA